MRLSGKKRGAPARRANRGLCVIRPQKSPKNKKTGVEGIVFRSVNALAMLLFSATMVYPVWYVLVASVTDYRELMAKSGMLLWTNEPTLSAYRMAFKNPLILTSYANTLFIVAAGTLISLMLTSVAAYFLTRRDVKLQKPIYLMIIITMYFNGGMIPFYFTVRDLGLENSLWSQILPTALNTFNLILMKVSLENMPRSLEESAEIDGAGHWSVLFRIVLPLSKATLAVIGLYYAVGYWNSWFNAMLFIREREKFPLQLVLREILLQNQTNEMAGGANYSEGSQIGEAIKYAVIVIATLPIFFVYPFLQKYFVKGVMIGAVKE